MAGDVINLKPKQEGAILAFCLTGTSRRAPEPSNHAPNVVSVAERARVRQSLSKGAPKGIRPSHGQLHRASSAAVTVMMKTMVEPSAGGSVRLRAADMAYSHAAKAIEIEDVDLRVSELERGVELSKSSR